jgi:exosortase
MTRPDWSNLPAILYVWLPACVLAFLMGAVPYGTGYGFERITMAFMMRELWKLPDWEHCAFVPLAIAFIVYEMRDKLALLTPSPSLWGYPLVAFGLLLYWAGQRVDNQYIGYAAMQWLIASWVVLMFGWRFFLQLLFPLLFVVFLWPLLFLETYLAFPLRLIMSEASVLTLNAIGVDAVKVGTAILSAPNPITNQTAGAAFSVDVADPCSGIRSLFALMMVSALYGFFVFNKWWKHALIFVCSIPLAILGNLVRILLLTVGTIAFGSEFAIGKGIDEPSTFHMLAGFFVFGVAISGMLGIGWLLNFNLKDFLHALTHARPVETTEDGTHPDMEAATQNRTKPREDLY